MKYKYVKPFDMNEGYPASFTVGEVYEDVTDDGESVRAGVFGICLVNDEKEDHYFDDFNSRDEDGFCMADYFEQVED